MHGDDFRYLDWNLYGRLERLFLKLYEEERELPVRIFLDASESMTFGEPRKFDFARQVAAAMGYVALSGFDRVSVIPFPDLATDRECRRRATGCGTGCARGACGPCAARRSAIQFFQNLSALTAGGAANLNEALRRGALEARQAGVAVVLSDFLDPAGYETGPDGAAGSRVPGGPGADSRAGRVVARRRSATCGWWTPRPARTQEVTFGRFRLKAYRQTVQNFMQRLREFCQARGINFFTASSNTRLAGTAAQATEEGGGVGIAMHFLAPLAFAFAATIPVVVVFYLLKRKRVVKLVSSTLLWQKFLAETQASAPFQKLRKNWLLILQIILLTLAVLALARPYFSATAKPAQRRVVILDASASMQATDESPSRFEKARAEALKWVDSLKDTDEMVIVLAGATTEVKQSATSEKAALRRALQSCTCSDGPTRLLPALRMAESLVRDLDQKTGPEIHLFSDGAVPELNEFENKALPLVYHRVGKAANNLGITALDVRANPEDARQRAIYASVANFSPEERQTDLELLFDDRLLETRPLTIPPGQTSPQVFKANQSRDGVFTGPADRPGRPGGGQPGLDRQPACQSR